MTKDGIFVQGGGRIFERMITDMFEMHQRRRLVYLLSCLSAKVMGKTLDILNFKKKRLISKIEVAFEVSLLV